MKISDEERERRLSFAREQAARAWTEPATANKVMDVELAEEFALILLPIMYAPHLGCATTEQLIDELKARLSETELNYTTIGENI